jgi:hypothetical protein
MVSVREGSTAGNRLVTVPGEHRRVAVPRDVTAPLDERPPGRRHRREGDGRAAVVEAWVAAWVGTNGDGAVARLRQGQAVLRLDPRIDDAIRVHGHRWQSFPRQMPPTNTTRIGVPGAQGLYRVALVGVGTLCRELMPSRHHVDTQRVPLRARSRDRLVAIHGRVAGVSLPVRAPLQPSKSQHVAGEARSVATSPASYMCAPTPGSRYRCPSRWWLRSGCS